MCFTVCRMEGFDNCMKYGGNKWNKSWLSVSKHVQFPFCDRSTGSCICLLCVSVIFCQQGHIHDPVLLSQDRNCTCFLLLLIASISVLAILVARNIITLCCINTRTLYHGPSTTDVPHTCALVARAKVKWHHTRISTGRTDVTLLWLFLLLFYTPRQGNKKTVKEREKSESAETVR